MTPDLAQPVRLTGNRCFLRPLAECVSRPPWTWRAAALAVVVSFGGIFGVPRVLGLLSPVGWDEAFFISPSLIMHLPMLCCLGYLKRRAGTTIVTAFGLRGGRVGKVLVSSVVLFILEALLVAAVHVVRARFGLAAPAGHPEEVARITSSFFRVTERTVLGPLCEELAFRGLLYTSLRTRFGIVSSSVASAAMFALIHRPDSVGAAGVFFFPNVLSSLWYERTRSLWPNVIAHSLLDTLVFVGAVLHARG